MPLVKPEISENERQSFKQCLKDLGCAKATLVDIDANIEWIQDILTKDNLDSRLFVDKQVSLQCHNLDKRIGDLDTGTGKLIEIIQEQIVVKPSQEGETE